MLSKDFQKIISEITSNPDHLISFVLVNVSSIVLREIIDYDWLDSLSDGPYNWLTHNYGRAINFVPFVTYILFSEPQIRPRSLLVATTITLSLPCFSTFAYSLVAFFCSLFNRSKALFLKIAFVLLLAVLFEYKIIQTSSCR